MHDYFVISFTADGKQYTARVYPDHGEDGSRFYQVQYEQDRTIFVEPAQTLADPLWRIREGDFIQPKVSGDFIYQVGSAIDAIED